MVINANKLNGISSYLLRNHGVGFSGDKTGKKPFTVSGTGKRDVIEFTAKDGSTISVPVGSNKSSETQRIIYKLRCGKKLSPAELEYLRKNEPETFRKVQQIQYDRQRLEEQLKNAKNKKQADAIYAGALSSAIKNKGEGGEEMEIRLSQYRDAYQTARRCREEEGEDEDTDKEKKEKSVSV